MGSPPSPPRSAPAPTWSIAIRPPQLDLFATDVLSWITTEGSSDADMILHLDDLLEHRHRRAVALLRDPAREHQPIRRRPAPDSDAWQSYPISLNCGSTGQILPDQFRKVREWIEGAPEDTFVGLMCHHPFDDLEPHTRSSLGWLWREKRLGSLVTAHTHAGYFQHHDLGGPVDQLELNLGSTTDWPMEWRTMQTFVDVDRREVYVKSERHTLVDALRHHEGYFQRGWEIPIDAPDDYRRYKQGYAASAILVDFYLAHHLVPYWLPQPHIRPNAAATNTEEQVKDTLLWTYFRLLRAFPTDPTRSEPR